MINDDDYDDEKHDGNDGNGHDNDDDDDDDYGNDDNDVKLFFSCSYSYFDYVAINGKPGQ